MKEKFYKFFKNLQPLSERASFRLSLDTVFITVGKILVDEIDFENFAKIYCSSDHHILLKNKLLARIKKKFIKFLKIYNH